MSDETATAVDVTPVEAAAKQKSYLGFTQKVNRFMLDDGVSYIEHKPMDEGTYEKFQDLTSKIKLDRTGENTEVDMALGRSRQFLRESLVTGWNLVDENENAIAYSATRLSELPPDVISALIDDIYKANKILSGEDTEETKKA